MDFTRLSWTQEDYNNLVLHLKSLSEESYKSFSEKLIPNTDNILGVRLPLLKTLAKQIAKGNINEFLDVCKGHTHEEILLEGFAIGLSKVSIDKVLNFIKDFVPKIKNWAVCDSFCSCLKIAALNKPKIFDFLKTYFYSDKEFYIRFGVVMLMDYFIEEEYIDSIFEIFDFINHDGYYVKMAVAWAVSICFVKLEDKTNKYLETCNLDDFTYNKALQKIIESNRVDKNKKDIIRQKKRKILKVGE